MADVASGAEGGAMDIVSLRSRRLGAYTHTYTPRDAMLYALGLGCTADADLRYVYEGAEGFAVLPTYAIVAAHPALGLVPLESYLPGGLDRAAALHGEQYLELLGPALPPEGGRLVSRPQLVDVQAKGSGLVVVLRTVTTDADSGRDVAINEFTTFILGKGNVPTPWPPAPRTPAAVAPNEPPSRPPDSVAVFATSRDQAALYRLSGDYNPLHIDPRVSARVGFKQPILHGLCTLGVSVRLVLRAFGGDDPARLKSVKVRFSKHVLPGETLRVEMWAEHPPQRPQEQEQEHAVSNPEAIPAPPPLKIIFRTWVVERKALAIANAAVELRPPAAVVGPAAAAAAVAAQVAAAPATGSSGGGGAAPVAARPASRL